jgi:beta-glucanase (GH16 family)
MAAEIQEGSTMRWRYKLAIGVPVIGAVAVLAAVVPAGVPAFGARAAVTTVAHAGPAVRPPRGKPTFDATFSGRHLDTETWATCYWWAGPKGCKNFPKKGKAPEYEWYLPSQVRVSGGVVHLVAQRKKTKGTNNTGKKTQWYGCRSGMLTTYRSFKFEYGFVQVVAKIPHASGLWPALWLDAANAKSRTEIDMVESWGVNAETASFFHSATGSTARARYSPSLTRGWRTYSLTWTSSMLRFYVGSKLVLTVSRHVPHQRMYFIADLAEYMPAKRGTCSSQLEIRSVKIWKA